MSVQPRRCPRNALPPSPHTREAGHSLSHPGQTEAEAQELHGQDAAHAVSSA